MSREGVKPGTMKDKGRCLGCGRWFEYEVPKDEFETGIITHLPGWCEDCGELLEALDFKPESELAD